ncbi:denticleless protein homolog isoform X2 [Oryctolagus cuniculus]|uniref:Denticleless protein homolog n=1 Tax=Oryctolagus cuniculus TaxID=9986 RepID=G1SDA5_RABIT|nr:denticleless protein homolog isoform X2 [Oryctolagus cuniculus]XP_051676513.1 denticleless protein homolog isoform X2 [Oryctolagus cuniculus]XP_051676514.1 denticleless protein homolog isoform X2 [Oryctolagus cuniculus]
MYLTLSGWSSQYPLQSLLTGYQCTCNDEHTSYGETGVPVPPFGCTFSSAPNMEHILAVANEEGFVRLYNTESQTLKKKCFKEWMAHWNAVFDLAWVPGEFKLVTAAGDQTAKFWDVKAGELLGTCKGHQCSLKSVAFSKFEKAVFCTGGRDGNIMVWDTRCNKKDGFYRQVNQISGAHNTSDKHTPSKPKKKQNAKGLAPSVDFQQSVTVVLFQDENTLVSAGAVDGIIKVWDLRKNYTAYRQEPIASKSFLYPGSSTRKLGYSSLILDSTGSTLFANCTDDNIYMFNMTGLKTSPVAVFNGHQNSTFYVKSSLSPDDQFLLSGSSDEAAYIWKVSTPWHPPTVLLGHFQEVTSVCWCPSDFTKIATCSDDNTLKIWRLNRGLEEKPGGDKLSIVGWASQKKKETRAGLATVTSSQSTPAKAPRVKSSPSVSSPSSAACAPSCAGDLPLPSNTPTFSIKTPPAKARSPINRRGSVSSVSPKPLSSFKMSIRNWVTRTPSSSPPITPPASETKIMSPRKALIPVSQKSSQAETCSESRNRVKRRLDSSCLESVKQKCVKSCNCVTELDGQVENLHLDLCCLAGNQEDLSKDTLGPTKSSKIEGASTSISEPPSPVSPYVSESCGTLPLPLRPCGEGSEVVGKENSSPENKNWLLAMAAKRKAENSSPRSPSSQTPNSRRQSGKTSPGPVTITPNSMRKICTYFHRKSQDDFCSPEHSTEL